MPTSREIPSLFTKLKVANSTIRNWPVIFLDKLGLVTLVTYKMRNGLVFRCRSRSSDGGVVTVVVSGQEYPPKYLNIEHKTAVVVDIGANVGAFSIYLTSLHPDKEIRGYAFEPSAENYELLKTNLELNHMKNIQTVNSAISDRDGTVHLTVEPKHKGEISVSTTGTGPMATAMRLSTFCISNKIESIDLLKLDVEGSEYAIIDADKEFICDAVRNIIMEYHQSPDGRYVDWIKDQLSPAFDIETIDEKLTSGVIFCRNKKYNH